MWVITHVETGAILTNYDGSKFYSAKEAHKFLLQARRRLTKLATIYYMRPSAIMKVSRHGVSSFNGLKPFGNPHTTFYNYLKVRFYVNQKRYDAMEESLVPIFDFYSKHGLLISGKIYDLYTQLKRANLYFIIHKVN